MMKSLGYEVYSYASEENEADVTELITIYPKSDQLKWFGDNDFHTKFFNITWNPSDEHWVAGNARASQAIRKRIKPGDIICLIAGSCQQAIALEFPNNPVVEYGIGYKGTFADFRVFESYAHMHWVYGNQDSDNGIFYDAVIPNYFDPADFKVGYEKDDYYLFIGRLIQRKGAEIAVEATRRLGTKLIMAGQGVVSKSGNKIIAEDGMIYEGDHIEHIGHVGVEERAELMSKAKAVFVPTTYLEPFGGVSIEAMFCGTPVIATDFGAFPENVIHGLSGFRFRTIGEATKFAELSNTLVPSRIALYARKNFSTSVIKYKYDSYFQQLTDLYNGGGFYSDWYPTRLGRYGKSY
jgi:glycosyltransferase involved in cell wall biosynthesis